MYRTLDRIRQWIRYPQTTRQQQQLLGLTTHYPDLEFTARRMAAEETVSYIMQHMRQTPNYATDWDLHEAIPSMLPLWRPGQLHLEFGVATGRTINHFARRLPREQIHGFDSFVGLPESWHYLMPRGCFHQTRAPRVRSNVTLHTGLFDDTLPRFLNARTSLQEHIAFMHIDCDLYSSTRTVLELTRSQLRPGTVILFDEYFNYPGWHLDEFRAWQEFVAQSGIRYEYIARVNSHQQCAVRILTI